MRRGLQDVVAIVDGVEVLAAGLVEVGEFSDLEAVVLRGEPQLDVTGRLALHDADKGTRPVGRARQSAAPAAVPEVGPCEDLRPLRRRLVVGDFLWAVRIANVEYADAGLEVPAREQPRVVL